MKKLLLSIIMLLCVDSAFSQTADKLIKKYKALPNAEYADNTEESRKGLLESEANGENGLTTEDYNFIRKNFKKSEQVQVALDDNLKAVLDKDIEGLKGYELLFTQNDNTEPKEGETLIQNMINHTFNLDYKLRFYGKTKDDVISDLLIRMDIFGKVVLAHIDCKLKKEHLMQAFVKGYKVSLEDDAEETGMNDVMKEVKEGNVLFVIDGKECPELRSLDETKEYMEKHDFHFNHESWVVGSAVKEKYPNTDKKVVIEFSRTDKKEQK